MTNSIATAKCPTVLSSGNYGMSQSCYTDDSKEYIFVKLTDSAFRAIEEYQRNEHAQRFNVGQNAKIQFSGNKGILHFPTPEANAEGRQFGFAIDELEGSLECLHQSQHQLDVLGALAYRMRIHANDDVYDTTRTKMAIAEETEKSKCIREIKPNQTDIGRKVKKSLTNLTSSSSNSSNNNNNNNNNNSSNNNNSNSNYLSNRSKLTATNSKSPTASKSPNPLVNSSSCNISNGNCNNNQQQQQSQQHVSNSLGSSAASTLFAQFANSISNGYAEMGTPPPSAAAAAPVPTSAAALNAVNTTASNNNKTNKLGSGFVSRANNKTAFGKSGNSNSTSNSKLPDISRRKIRERLIHLLALKPFKKPELYARLQNEGLRDRERPLISNILKDISTLSRDNTFNLKRQMWNDVNENWPYYTEQELQQLKRRKPQNLTPPLSSDAGSSTSGQSPTSIHTGSPPPLGGNVAQMGSNAIAGNNNNTKRSNLEVSGSNYEDNFLGVQPKKQRISHFKKDPGPGAVAAVNQRYGATFRPATSSSVTTVSSAYSGSGQNATGTTGRNTTKHRAAKSPSVTAIATTAAASHEANEPISTDLSFNVLDNVDELMPQMLQEQHNSSLFNSQRKNISANNNKNNNNNNSNNNIKEKSRSSNNNNNNNYNNNNNNSNSKNNDAKCNNNIDMSAKPYVNFVPEKRKQQQKQQVPVPPPPLQQQQQQAASLIKSLNNNNSSNNNSSSSSKTSGKLYSPNSMDDMQQFTNTNSSNNINNNNNVSFHSNSPIGRSNSLSGKNRYSQQQQQQQPQPQQQQHKNMRQHQQPQQTQANLLPPPAPTNTTTTAAAAIVNNNQQQQPQQNYSSPTQQIAAAASTYATTSLNETMPRQKYDFSQYTPITSIEQRRKYKTEFEADYDEYLKLLAQIEGVGKRFRALADQLENARQGCADYDEIKQKILIEYERIRNEDSLKRDKQRFDYLHEKLAHIKQLVADYDKTLTDAAVAQAQAAAVAAQQQQQQQQQQQRQQQIYEQRRQQQQQSQRLSPMVMSGGESNQSPPMQYQQMLMQQQHHSAETIQLQQQQQQQQQAQQQSSITSNNTARQSPQMNADYALYVQQQKQHAQQQQLQHQQQQQQQQQLHDKQVDGVHNTVHIHNSDSDSSSSSDDDDDDDQSNDDDDDSNSNDDD